MTRFLVGPDLKRPLAHIVGGDRLRCAVAFWGAGAVAFFKKAGARMDKTEIVCNVDMGGTSPMALTELGAPQNERLRHDPRLHAKVYLSSHGVIIGSANASDGGVGFTDAGAHLTEAATFHESNTRTWQEASAWFEDLYRGACQVDAAAVEKAKDRFGGVKTYPFRRPARPGSLLDMVRSTPERFGHLGFVITRVPTTEATRSKARKRASEFAPEVIEELKDDGGFFIGWLNDVHRWPASFVELWLPHRALYIFLRSTRLINPKTGDIFAAKDRKVKNLLPPDTPATKLARTVDALTVRKLLDKTGGGAMYPTALHLADALEGL